MRIVGKPCSGSEWWQLYLKASDTNYCTIFKQGVPRASFGRKKKWLKKSERYKNAYITKDYAPAIEEERGTLIKAVFAAREKGRDSKVINRRRFIDNQAHDINCIPNKESIARSLQLP